MFHPSLASHRASERDIDDPTPTMTIVRFSLTVMFVLISISVLISVVRGPRASEHQ